MKVAVITISDRAAEGIYEDLSGPEIESIVKESYPGVQITREIVPDQRDDILAAFAGHRSAQADYIITTGGTGISPRDITPEVTAEYCDRELPGIAEVLRAESYRETRNAMLSRGFAGLKGNTFIINFPGSLKAVRLCTRVLIPIMEHGLKMLRGGGHSQHLAMTPHRKEGEIL